MPVRARRYEIYLPVEYNDGTPIEDAAYDRIEQDCLHRFGGVTQIRRSNPLRGLWREGEMIYQDNIVLFTMIDFSDQIEENQSFMEEYKEFLKERLQQREILVTFHDLYVL